MNAFIQACIDANKEVYEYLNTHLTSLDFNYSNTIGYGGDNSLNIDLYCEEVFFKHLNSFGQIYSEESGAMNNSSDLKIIIDPLDGSSNFKAQLPYYGSSIALSENNSVINSVICNLATGILYYKQGNAKIIQFDLKTSKEITPKELGDSKLAIFERAYAYSNLASKLSQIGQKFRSPGAVAVSLATARNYDFVLFAGKIRPFDIVAGLHMNEDLLVYQSGEFLIVTKNQDKLDQLKEIIKE